MYVRIASFLGLAAIAGAGWAAPEDTSGSSDQSQSSTTSGSQAARVQEPTIPPPGHTARQDQQGHQDQARLVATDELIGRDVLTREGERVGTLEYITLDLDQGKVSHLVVDTSNGDFQPSSSTGGSSTSGAASPSGSSQSTQSSSSSQSMGQQDGELVVMPWSIAKVGDDSVTVAATGHHLANAPRLGREELNRLAEPAMVAYVVDYWAPASELAALESRGQQQDESPGQPPSGSSQSQQPQSQEQESPQMRDPMRSDEHDRRLDQSRVGVDPGSSEQTTSSLSGTSAGETTSGSSAQGTGSSEPRTEGQTVLVGQEVVTAVNPPMFQLSEDLQGAKVTDRSGEELGEIRRIMIDTDTGDAAFAVLESVSRGRAAVPLQSLEWTAKGTTMLSADPSALQTDEAIIDRPTEVDRNQLAQLYERFDVEPYWQRSGSTGASTQPTP